MIRRGPPRQDKVLDHYGILSGMVQPPAPRTVKPRAKSTEPLEKQILAGVMKALRFHPKVGWIGRYNSGAMEADGRYVTFNTICGQSDLMGQMKDGRMLAIEVKRPGKAATPSQGEFLAMVTKYNGVAGVVHSIDEAMSLVNL
jgi:hypothetical protein